MRRFRSRTSIRFVLPVERQKTPHRAAAPHSTATAATGRRDTPSRRSRRCRRSRTSSSPSASRHRRSPSRTATATIVSTRRSRPAASTIRCRSASGRSTASSTTRSSTTTRSCSGMRIPRTPKRRSRRAPTTRSAWSGSTSRKDHYGLHGTPEPRSDRPHRIARVRAADELGCAEARRPGEARDARRLHGMTARRPSRSSSDARTFAAGAACGFLAGAFARRADRLAVRQRDRLARGEPAARRRRTPLPSIAGMDGLDDAGAAVIEAARSQRRRGTAGDDGAAPIPPARRLVHPRTAPSRAQATRDLGIPVDGVSP